MDISKVLGNIFRFFWNLCFGTKKRTKITFIVLGIILIIGMISPETVESVFGSVTEALRPLIEMILNLVFIILIMAIGLGIMLKALGIKLK
jgi:uncharacterized membrane protein (DUF106 family)